jgi:hypothetical protein
MACKVAFENNDIKPNPQFCYTFLESFDDINVVCWILYHMNQCLLHPQFWIAFNASKLQTNVLRQMFRSTFFFPSIYKSGIIGNLVGQNLE